MIERIVNPRIIAVLALLVGIAAGPFWFWKNASVMISKVASTRHAANVVDKQKQEQQRAHGWDFWTIQMENLASELKEEKARLHKQSEDMEREKARLDAERQELDRLRSDILSMRQEIDDRVIMVKADEVKNLKTLAQTYATLTPAGAVAIIRELDDATAVKILSLMKPDSVGPIFEAMATTASPDGTLARRVAALSEKLRLIKAAQAQTTATASN
jgi:flagellar motility protein MotE (MotC chaperone)